MKATLILLLGFLSLVLQSTLLHEWPSASVRFDIPFLLVLYLALYGESTEGGLWTVLFLGLMSDILGARFMGELTILYTILYFGIRLVRQNIFLDSPISLVMAVGVFSCIKELLQFGVSVWLGNGQLVTLHFIAVLALQVLWNLLVAFLLFSLLDRFWPHRKREGAL